MGIQLEGADIDAPGGSMTSEPVVCGSVQIPPSGHPIVLLSECQTVGGYAKIATVIHADISVMAQLRPGDRVRFCRVSLDEAIEIRRRRAKRLSGLLLQIRDRVQTHM